jgi:hypothetical protein
MRLAKGDGLLRLLVIGRHARAQVEQWLAADLSYGDVLTKLHRSISDESSSTRGES